jgi:hypothetical protein
MFKKWSIIVHNIFEEKNILAIKYICNISCLHEIYSFASGSNFQFGNVDVTW